MDRSAVVSRLLVAASQPAEAREICCVTSEKISSALDCVGWQSGNLDHDAVLVTHLATVNAVVIRIRLMLWVAEHDPMLMSIQYQCKTKQCKTVLCSITGNLTVECDKLNNYCHEDAMQYNAAQGIAMQHQPMQREEIMQRIAMQWNGEEDHAIPLSVKLG